MATLVIILACNSSTHVGPHPISFRTVAIQHTADQKETLTIWRQRVKQKFQLPTVSTDSVQKENEELSKQDDTNTD